MQMEMLNLHRSMEELDALHNEIQSTWNHLNKQPHDWLSRRFVYQDGVYDTADVQQVRDRLNDWGFTKMRVFGHVGNVSVTLLHEMTEYMLSFIDKTIPHTLLQIAHHLLQEQYRVWTPDRAVNFDIRNIGDLEYLNDAIEDFLYEQQQAHARTITKGYVHPDTYRELRMMRGPALYDSYPMFPVRFDDAFNICDVPIDRHRNIPKNTIMFSYTIRKAIFDFGEYATASHYDLSVRLDKVRSSDVSPNQAAEDIRRAFETSGWNVILFDAPAHLQPEWKTLRAENKDNPRWVVQVDGKSPVQLLNDLATYFVEQQGNV